VSTPQLYLPRQGHHLRRRRSSPPWVTSCLRRLGGQPLYLLETLKLLRERELLVPRRGADGVFRLEPTVDIAAALAQEQSHDAPCPDQCGSHVEMALALAQEQCQRELVPPSVRTMIQARLARLTQPARQLVLARTVLCTRATAQWLWQVAELGVEAGVEALEEAVASGILREEEAGAGRPSRYHFAHEFSLLKNVLTKLISKEQCIPSYLLSNLSLSVREKTDTPKKDESTTQKQPKRSHTWPLLDMGGVPSPVV
jgi:hypothetical protein